MLRLFTRRSRDVSYLTEDPAHELDDVRDGPARWWLRGGGEVERVLTSTARASVVGYDLVIAAPRPVSILLARDETHAPGVVAAHRVAVAAAIDYLDDHALVVRDRLGGEDLDVPASWANVVGFTHGLNRHGEPHLHDHVLVGARPAGFSAVLDARALRAHAPTADALYRSTLRHELAERTPWHAWRSFTGVEMVAGLDEGWRELWGGHHPDGGTKLHWSRADTRGRWTEDAARFEERGVVPAPVRRSGVDEHAFGAALEGRPSVARRRATCRWPWTGSTRNSRGAACARP